MSKSTVTATESNVPGFYGKVPVLGDFVSRRLPQDFIQPWDLWLQHAMFSSREQLGTEWLEVYLTSPIWRFSLSPGVAGPESWVGVLMPSVDRVGRYFPFTIAQKIDNKINPFNLLKTEQSWFESAEALALSALDDSTPTIDKLDEGAVALGSACNVNVTELSIGTECNQGWWLPSEIELGNPKVMDSYLPRLVDKLLDTCSLWWTTGSRSIHSGIALCKGLPDSQGYAAMLAGRWQEFGWGDLSLEQFNEVMNVS